MLATRRRQSGKRSRNLVAALPFVLPGLILVSVFIIVPMVFTIRISLSTYDIVEHTITFTGIVNYINVLTDSAGMFWLAYRNNFMYAIVTVPFIVMGGMIFSYLINNLRRGKMLFRVGFYLPVITSWVIVSLVFYYLFSNGENGLFNYLLVDVFHVLNDYVTWLDLEWPANAALWIMGIWKNIGWSVLIFLAALQTIPKDLYEASELDGAGGWRKFRYITISCVKPTTYYVLVQSIIGAFNVLIQVLMLTQGDPSGATSTLQYLLFDQAFNQFNFGEASAVGLIAAVTIVVLTFILNKLLKLDQSDRGIVDL